MEKEQISLLKKGDKKAFEEFVSLYEKKIYRYAYNFTKNPDDALDITQEVFLKVHKNIKKFKENSSLSTWVYRITSNVCIDFSRKNKLTIPITEENEDYILNLHDNSTNIEDLVANKDISEDIAVSLSKLDDDAKQIVIMRDVLELSYNEISDALKLEVGTVKSRISRSRKKLRNILIDLWNKNNGDTSNNIESEVE